MTAFSHLDRFAWLALGAVTCACSFDSSLDLAESLCVEGATVACECAGGTLGAQACGADGIFGACQCDAPPASGAGGMLQPVGGSGGGDIGDDSDEGVGGSAGEPQVEVDAGAMDPSGGAGGIAGSGDAGPIPGSGGTGGVTGMAGDSATGGTTGPKQGEAYGPCRDDGSCDLPMFCMFGAERYCAPLCNGNGRGALACPPPPSGGFAFCVRNICTPL